MKRLSTGLITALLVAAAPLSTRAAEIALKQSAVQKLVVQGLFTRDGRYVVQPGPCHVHFENPAVTLVGGRIVIRSHLSARLGLAVGSSCQGAGSHPRPRSPAGLRPTAARCGWSTSASTRSTTARPAPSPRSA